MVSIGMSNASEEFGGPDVGAFKQRFDDPAFVEKNPNLVVINGAKARSTNWAAHDAAGNPTDGVWNVLDTRLANANVAGPQVQVAWIKQAYIFDSSRAYCCPPPPFPNHAQYLQTDIEQILRNVKKNIPTASWPFFQHGRTHIALRSTIPRIGPLKLASPTNGPSRTRSTEPETLATPATHPLLLGLLGASANGTVARSDGLLWDCTYLDVDLVHPSPKGIAKVADQLIAFFETDPTTSSWFLKPSLPGLTFNVTTVPPPHGTGSANGSIYRKRDHSEGSRRYYNWSFDDGDTFYDSKTVVKTFPAPGTYNVHAAAVDTAGNSIQKTVTVTVTP